MAMSIFMKLIKFILTWLLLSKHLFGQVSINFTFQIRKGYILRHESVIQVLQTGVKCNLLYFNIFYFIKKIILFYGWTSSRYLLGYNTIHVWDMIFLSCCECRQDHAWFLLSQQKCINLKGEL